MGINHTAATLAHNNAAMPDTVFNSAGKALDDHADSNADSAYSSTINVSCDETHQFVKPFIGKTGNHAAEASSTVTLFSPDDIDELYYVHPRLKQIPSPARRITVLTTKSESRSDLGINPRPSAIEETRFKDTHERLHNRSVAPASYSMKQELGPAFNWLALWYGI